MASSLWLWNAWRAQILLTLLAMSYVVFCSIFLWGESLEKKLNLSMGDAPHSRRLTDLNYTIPRLI